MRGLIDHPYRRAHLTGIALGGQNDGTICTTFISTALWLPFSSKILAQSEVGQTVFQAVEDIFAILPEVEDVALLA